MTRVLVADDEAMLRKYLRRFLEGLGYEVTTADNGKQAMAAMEEQMPDVLVTDLHMPDMDGFEVLRALRKKGARIPVIAMTGGGPFNKELLLGSAAALGAVLTLQKPFELDELRAVLEEAVRGRTDEES